MSRNSKENPPVSASRGNVQKATHVIRRNKCCTEEEREVIRRLGEQREVAIWLRKQKQNKNNQVKTMKDHHNGEETRPRRLQINCNVNENSRSDERCRREKERQSQLKEAHERKKRAREDEMVEVYEQFFIRRKGLPEIIRRPTNTQRRMAKQQVRTGRWRADRKHQQAGNNIRKAAKKMMAIKDAMKPQNKTIVQKVLDDCVMTRAQANEAKC